MDNNINKVFIDIIKCYLSNSDYLPTEEIDINALITLADSQKLIAMVYLVLKKSNIALSESQHNIFKQYYYASVKTAALQTRTIKTLTKSLEEKGFAFCFFKGADLRKLYAPNEEIRTMGDIDILINDSDKQIIINELMEQGVSNVGYYKGTDSLTFNSSRIEMHGVVNYFDKDIVNATDIENNSLPYDKYLYLLVTHIAHHIATSGCGLRQIIDIAKFYEAYDKYIDYDNYNRYMADIKFDRFGKIITMLVEKLLNVKSNHCYDDLDESVVNDSFVEFMRDFLLSNGVFGHDDVSAVAEMRSAKLYLENNEKTSKFKTFMNLVFPSPKRLINTFPKLKKHKWLYPYYLIVRIYKAIFVKKISGKTVIKGINNTKKINEKITLLKALNIK